MKYLSLVLFAALLVGLLPFSANVVRADEEGESAGPTDAERAEVQKLVAELRAEASRIRGLEWKADVPADLLSRDQLRKNMEEMVRKELKPEVLERDTRIMRRIGLLREDQDPLEIALSMMQEMVAGYFDPDAKRLYLIAGIDAEGQRPVILHELIHALEDQHFDLKKRIKRHEEDSDRLFVEKVITEGSAEMARFLYENAHPEAALAHLKAQAKNSAQAAGQQRVLARTPGYMLIGTLLHYRVGPNFVRQYVEGDYAGRIGTLYENPPASQEQVLHPSKFLGEELDLPKETIWHKDPATALGPEWKKLYDLPLGELDLALYLDFFLGDDKGLLTASHVQLGTFVDAEANTAARGWDGGRAYYMEKDGEGMAVITALDFDTEKDAEEAAKAFGRALEIRNGEAWSSEGWKESKIELVGPSSTEADAHHMLQYEGLHGPGAVIRKKTHVYQVDGLKKALLEKALGNVMQTRFVQDARDTWDAAEQKDAFAGFDYVDRRRGIGVRAAEGWTVDAAPDMARAQDPTALAVMSKGDVRLVVSAADQGLSRGGLPAILKVQVARMIGMPITDDHIKDAKVGGYPGIVFQIPFGGATTIRIYLGSDGVRTFTVILRAPTEAVAPLEAEIEKALQGIKSIATY